MTDDPQPTKKQRGGRRPGAGRPPSGTKRMEIRVKPETEKAIQAEATRLGISHGAVVDRRFNG